MSDLSDNAIRAYAANIFDLEDAREEAQTDLKGAWSHIREAHGKRFADSLKLAVKRARQDADKRAAADEVDAEAERIMAILASRAPRATRIREIIEEFDPETGEVGTVAPALADDGQQANIKATPTIHEPEAAMLPQTAGSKTAVANSTPGSGAGTVDAGGANWPSEMTTASPANEPETIPPVADPATVVSEAGDRSAVPHPSAAPVVASNVTAFRTHNPETHFLNSKGIQRLHGCLNAEVCAGSRSKLCFTCSTQHEGPAFQGGVA